MSRDEAIYDLGEVLIDKPHPAFQGVPAKSRSVPTRHGTRPESGGVRPALAGSLSMFVPGLGLMLTGDIGWGFFYLPGTGVCAAILWAVLGSLDRLVPTLRLLDVPIEALIVTVASLASTLMGLHLAAILHSQAQAALDSDQAAPHPIVAGFASLLIPGWGQLLAAHRRRAALFLGGIWLLSLAWLLVTPAGSRVLSGLSITLPAKMRDGWGPAVLLSAPAVLWVIAVYDAVAGAVAERRR